MTPTNEVDHSMCRQIDGKCMGWHCAYCGQACGEQGHECKEREEAAQERDAIAQRIKENL